MLDKLKKSKTAKGLASLIAPLIMASGIYFSNIRTANADAIGDFIGKQIEEIVDHTVKQVTNGRYKTYKDAIEDLKIPEAEEKTKPKDTRVFGAVYLRDGTILKNVRYKHEEFIFQKKGRKFHISPEDILLIDFSKEKNKDIVYLRDGSLLKDAQYIYPNVDVSNYLGNMQIDQDEIKIFLFGRKGTPKKKLENKANMERLTNNPLNDNYAFWSPDGKKIAYLVYEPGGEGNICVMDADGSNKKKLTPIYMGTFSWSPDSKKIASISKEKENHYKLYVVDADGKNEKRLATIIGEFYDWFAWSPDSKKIAFSSRFPQNFDVYIANADGSDVKRVTTHPKSDVFHSWSPDGKKITITSDRSGNNEIYVVDVD